MPEGRRRTEWSYRTSGGIRRIKEGKLISSSRKIISRRQRGGLVNHI